MKQLASMATASSYFLQERTPNSQNHISCHYPQFPAHNSFADIRIRRNSKNLSCKCFFTTNSSSNDGPASDRQINKNRFRKMEIEQNPIEIVSKTIVNALKALQKPAAAAVLVVLLLMYNFNSALAASGGRMGGSSFSSRSSKSSSRSHSTPRIGAGSGFSYSVCAPSPVGGVYVDPAVGVGSNFSLIMIAFVAFIMVSVFLSECSESSVLTATEKTSVIKLQVGLLGLARSFQKDLNRIAETADTSTSEGLHYVLTETVLALLRHPDYCISAYSSVDIKRSMEGGEERFNQLSIEERGKFDEETLVNINNIKKQSSTIPRTGGFANEYIVVTILVAAGREHKLPLIYNSKDLKDALQKLASIPSSQTLAVEVLWTPQNEDDTLLERELLQDYPLLKPLQGVSYGEACLELLSQPLLYTERDIDVVDTEAKLSLRKM